MIIHLDIAYIVHIISQLMVLIQELILIMSKYLSIFGINESLNMLVREDFLCSQVEQNIKNNTLILAKDKLLNVLTTKKGLRPIPMCKS